MASPFCVSWMPTLLLVSSIYLCLSCPVCMTTTPFCYWKQYRYMLVIHVMPLSVCGGYGSCIAIPIQFTVSSCTALFLMAFLWPCHIPWAATRVPHKRDMGGCLKIRSPEFDGVSWVSLSTRRHFCGDFPHVQTNPYDSTSDQTWKNRDSMISCNISHFTQWYCQGIGRNSFFPQIRDSPVGILDPYPGYPLEHLPT